jgi:PPOX class probable F420-dependent enzyme
VPFRPSTADRPGQEAAGGGKPAPLASAKYLLLTSFNRDGAALATPVRVLPDGDRAYFWTSDASGISKRLRHTDWVQVSPCTVLGVCRTGPTVDATARLLAGDEASWAAEQLAPKYPAWRRLLVSLAHRVTGRQAVYYEVQPDKAAEQPAAPPAVAAQARQRAPVRLAPAGAGRRSGQ